MKLTLSYQGPLPPKQRGVSAVKADLRRAFHPQIKAQIGGMIDDTNRPLISTHIGGYDFISPAHEQFRTAIELDVLLLSPRSLRPGDVDNRLKTPIDGLTRPANQNQLQGFGEPDEGGATYCLMDDDHLVQRIGLDSRPWHVPQTGASDALVVVTATVVLAPRQEQAPERSSAPAHGRRERNCDPPRHAARRQDPPAQRSPASSGLTRYAPGRSPRPPAPSRPGARTCSPASGHPPERGALNPSTWSAMFAAWIGVGLSQR